MGEPARLRENPAVRFETAGDQIDLIVSPLDKLEEPPALIQLREAALARLRKEGYPVRDEDVERLSPLIYDHINLLADWCERGVRVVTVTQQIDLSGTVGHVVASVMFGLAEIELEYRRERQAAGIALAGRKGIYTGRQRGTTEAQPARARELHARGLTVAEIAKAMAMALAISKRTVFRYLSEAT